MSESRTNWVANKITEENYNNLFTYLSREELELLVGVKLTYCTFKTKDGWMTRHEELIKENKNYYLPFCGKVNAETIKIFNNDC